MKNLRDKIIGSVAGAAMIVGASLGSLAPAFAQEAQPSENVELASLPSFESVDRETAKARSLGGISLFFGSGFSEIAVVGISEILAERGYKVNVFSGGPADALTLCIDGKCADQNFDISTIGVLSTVVEQHGSYLLASKDDGTTLEHS